jgi:hypothetical protein
LRYSSGRARFILRQRRPHQALRRLLSMGIGSTQNSPSNGSAFTWFRQDTARTWLAANPGWEDDLETTQATWGRIYGALHGKPGETRVLILERGSDQRIVRAPVTA